VFCLTALKSLEKNEGMVEGPAGTLGPEREGYCSPYRAIDLEAWKLEASLTVNAYDSVVGLRWLNSSLMCIKITYLKPLRINSLWITLTIVVYESENHKI
jgi:hypothetical protein